MNRWFRSDGFWPECAHGAWSSLRGSFHQPRSFGGRGSGRFAALTLDLGGRRSRPPELALRVKVGGDRGRCLLDGSEIRGMGHAGRIMMVRGVLLGIGDPLEQTIERFGREPCVWERPHHVTEPVTAKVAAPHWKDRPLRRSVLQRLRTRSLFSWRLRGTERDGPAVRPLTREVRPWPIQTHCTHPVTAARGMLSKRLDERRLAEVEPLRVQDQQVRAVRPCGLLPIAAPGSMVVCWGMEVQRSCRPSLGLGEPDP